MKIKMGQMGDYLFFRRGENLYGETSSAEERPCSLSRPQ
jgi:hypothetical protein